MMIQWHWPVHIDRPGMLCVSAPLPASLRNPGAHARYGALAPFDDRVRWQRRPRL